MTTSRRQAALFGTVTALILYGSLYPFEFRVPLDGSGAWNTLLSGWAARPGRADFLANILLYMPFGWFGMSALPRPAKTSLRLALVALCGAGLSVTVELVQYFDVDRITSATDVYGNSLGTIAGSLCFAGLSAVPISLFVGVNREPIPIALIVFWAGYRFYPYVPTTDVHRYWVAVSPVLYQPRVNIVGLARHAAVWTTLLFLERLILRIKIKKHLDLITIAVVLILRIMLIDAPLSGAEIGGAVVAVVLSRSLRLLEPRQQAALLVAGLWSITLIGRLQPFQFQHPAQNFGLLPFRSLLAGSINVAVPTFCEKTFLYGSLLFLLDMAGCRRFVAVVAVSGSLLATSWLETWLPGRSAEITDAVMALLIAAAMALAAAPRRPRLA